MIRIAAATIAATLAVGALAYWRIQSTPPEWDRVRLHHWRYSKEMTRFAEAAIDHRDQFSWIALVDGEIVAGTDRELEVELDQMIRHQFRSLMDDAGLYYIQVVAPENGDAAYIDGAGGWRWDREFTALLTYERAGQNPESLCESQFREAEVGGCSMLLDENWAYEMFWYSREYIEREYESGANDERRITSP